MCICVYTWQFLVTPKKSTIFPGYNKVGQYSTFMLGVPLRTRMNIFLKTRKVTSGWGGQLHHYHQDLRRASASPEGSSSWAALASRPRPLSWQKFEPFSSLWKNFTTAVTFLAVGGKLVLLASAAAGERLQVFWGVGGSCLKWEAGEQVNRWRQDGRWRCGRWWWKVEGGSLKAEAAKGGKSSRTSSQARPNISSATIIGNKMSRPPTHHQDRQLDRGEEAEEGGGGAGVGGTLQPFCRHRTLPSAN